MTSDSSATKTWATSKVSNMFSMRPLEEEVRAAQDNDTKARQGLPGSTRIGRPSVTRDPTSPPPPPPPPPRPPSDDFETYDGDMSTRLDKLESFAETAKDRLARIETKLDHIDKEVASVKWWIVAQIAAGLFTVVTTVLGTGIAIQQMTVASFQGAAQVAKDSAPVAAPAASPPIIINVPQPAAPVATRPSK